MIKLDKACVFLLLALLLPGIALANASGDEEEFDAIHHVSDGYYLDFLPFAKVQLPRIFVVRDAAGSLGVEFYGSTTSAFLSGNFVVVPAEGEEVHYDAEHPPYNGVMAPTSGELVIDLSISRHLVFAWLGCLLVILIFTNLARRYQRGVGRETAPKGLFHNLFEAAVIFVRDGIARPNLGDKTDRFLPYLLTIFFFILFCNLLGLVPFGATATSNLMITAVLATFTFIFTQIGGTKDYWTHIFWPPGVPVLIKFILIPIEFLGIFTKPFALAVRLFANMTAGHLIILNLIGLVFMFTELFGTGAGYGVSVVSVAFSIFIYCLELLVAFIQTYIFTMLSALFIGMAVAEHDHHAHDDEHAHHGSEPSLLHEGTPAGAAA